ncbi:MAG: glutathione S-transferase family protein [Roseitalea sp.]|jgi:glutathione S-transferase|nr:glutathione S-transferase family protein [Roseitalea sp.]MBO6722277.1 glutathione S-transferase family protein [Roseitalea sp.]MBO6742394.1 glutathione S-transferase family protein [Roseitalea sp.]
MLTLWSMPSSGNSYKVRLLLAHLGVPFRHMPAEQGSGVTQSDAFRAINPAGKVPLLVLEDGRTIRESNAILLYLGDGTRFVPDDRYSRALVHQWMFFEQYSHEPAIAVRAGILTYDDRAHLRTPDMLDPLLEKGHAALDLMERQLEATPWLAGDTPSVADICLYAYTHCAGDKGGFDMDRFPAVNRWLQRAAAEPGHVPLEWLPEDAG